MLPARALAATLLLAGPPLWAAAAEPVAQQPVTPQPSAQPSCARQEIEPQETAHQGAADPIEIGQSVNGTAIVIRVYGQGPETLLLMASIHGSEPAGTPLLERFEKTLHLRPELLAGRRLVVLPIANPDGYAKRERLNANGVDLNRNFPADNREQRDRYGAAPLSEPEAAAIMRVLERYGPVRVLSIHQPLDCIDYDGPGQALAERMSLAIDGRLKVKKLGGRPGSLGSYVGESLKRPIITLELPRGAEEDPDQLWRDYSAAVVAFVEGAPPE